MEGPPSDRTSDQAACIPQAARHVVSSRRRPTRLCGRWHEPRPFFLCWGRVSWSGAVPCGTYASGPDAQRVVLPGYLRQESKLRPRETARSRENSLSAGRCLAGLLGQDACKCLCTRSCTQAAHSRTTGAESSLTSHRPCGAPCGPSAHTCAVPAPWGPPSPTLLVPQPPLHDRCSLVDVNLPHPHTGPVIQSHSSSPDMVPTLPGS